MNEPPFSRGETGAKSLFSILYSCFKLIHSPAEEENKDP